jgi:hypothetical protein
MKIARNFKMYSIHKIKRRISVDGKLKNKSKSRKRKCLKMSGVSL